MTFHESRGGGGVALETRCTSEVKKFFTSFSDPPGLGLGDLNRSEDLSLFFQKSEPVSVIH